MIMGNYCMHRGCLRLQSRLVSVQANELPAHPVMYLFVISTAHFSKRTNNSPHSDAPLTFCSMDQADGIELAIFATSGGSSRNNSAPLTSAAPTYSLEQKRNRPSSTRTQSLPTRQDSDGTRISGSASTTDANHSPWVRSMD